MNNQHKLTREELDELERYNLPLWGLSCPCCGQDYWGCHCPEDQARECYKRIGETSNGN